MKISFKNGIITGIAFIVIAILIGIIFESDIGFIFAGLGIVIIGITILIRINTSNNHN